MSRAMVTDLFPARELRRIFSMLVLVLGVSPVIAPLIGSYLLVWFGWNSAFMVQALLGTACLVGMHFRLPESLAHDARRPLRFDLIKSAYARLFKDRTFIGASVVCGFSSAGTFAYITSAPFVFIVLYKVPTERFGWLFGSVAAGMVVASQINGRMSHRIPLWRVLRTANTVQLFAGTLLLASVLTGLGRHVERFRLRLHLCFRAGFRVSQRIGHCDDAARRDRGHRVGVARHQPVPDRGSDHHVSGIHR